MTEFTTGLLDDQHHDGFWTPKASMHDYGVQLEDTEQDQQPNIDERGCIGEYEEIQDKLKTNEDQIDLRCFWHIFWIATETFLTVTTTYVRVQHTSMTTWNRPKRPPSSKVVPLSGLYYFSSGEASFRYSISLIKTLIMEELTTFLIFIATPACLGGYIGLPFVGFALLVGIYQFFTDYFGNIQIIQNADILNRLTLYIYITCVVLQFVAIGLCFAKPFAAAIIELVALILAICRLCIMVYIFHTLSDKDTVWFSFNGEYKYGYGIFGCMSYLKMGDITDMLCRNRMAKNMIPPMIWGLENVTNKNKSE